jgi:hypothetical protein
MIDSESKLMNQTSETPDRKLAPESTEVIVWDEPPEKIDQQKQITYRHDCYEPLETSKTTHSTAGRTDDA